MLLLLSRCGFFRILAQVLGNDSGKPFNLPILSQNRILDWTLHPFFAGYPHATYVTIQGVLNANSRHSSCLLGQCFLAGRG